MAVNATSAAQRLTAANALARAEALLRRSVQEQPVNYDADIDAAINTAINALQLIQSAA